MNNRSIIVSGGKEETLVFWKSQLNQKDFCPRFLSEIANVSVSVTHGLVSVQLQNGKQYVLRNDNFEIEYEHINLDTNLMIRNGKQKINLTIRFKEIKKHKFKNEIWRSLFV
jgi:hypothetical protein